MHMRLPTHTCNYKCQQVPRLCDRIVSAFSCSSPSSSSSSSSSSPGDGNESSGGSGNSGGGGSGGSGVSGGSGGNNQSNDRERSAATAGVGLVLRTHRVVGRSGRVLFDVIPHGVGGGGERERERERENAISVVSGAAVGVKRSGKGRMGEMGERGDEEENEKEDGYEHERMERRLQQLRRRVLPLLGRWSLDVPWSVGDDLTRAIARRVLGAPDDATMVQVVSKMSPLLLRHRGALLEVRY